MSLEAAENAEPAAVSESGPPPAAAVPEPAPPADAVPEPFGETAAYPAIASAERAEEDEVADELADGVEPAELAGPAEPGHRLHGRRGLVFAGLFTVAALAIVGGAIGIVAALTHGFHKPATVTYRESAVFKLHAGDCVNTPSGQLVSVLPCSAPHQAEVFATFSLPASAWPGTAAVRAAASSGCSARLSGYLNPQLSVSLAQSYVVPDQVAWTGGTRTVICEVQATSGQLTESVRAG